MLMSAVSHTVQLILPDAVLPGDLTIPAQAAGLVLFSHGSGSSRLSPRNRYVARCLQDAGLVTLLFDLLTPTEDETYATRFDIPLLTHRLLDATRWARQQPALAKLPLGLFGASTGAASALSTAAELGLKVRAVVCRGGRPDLALPVLPGVSAPTLLLVGSQDEEVVRLNQQALQALSSPSELRIVPGAGHLFEEPGTLEQVASAATDWYQRYLG
jgi:putative phosphoribosyl transferase